MFDTQTADLIRSAPAIRNVDPATLPQDLTRAYAELVSLRLRDGEPGADVARELNHQRLLHMATIYEAIVDTSTSADQRRAAAFVAGTAYQILGRVGAAERISPSFLLSASAIHPEVAAPLLFLIAEQSPDAREATRRLEGVQADDLLRTALLETIADLAKERFQEILDRAQRLEGLRPPANADLEAQAIQTLYGLCWSGVIQMVAQLLDQPAPATIFRRFDGAEATFYEVERLSLADIILPGSGAQLVSAYSGPRHLARLLRQVACSLAGTGLASLPAPAGANPQVWSQWIRHRAQTKPLLWPNHRSAITRGFLDQGRSAVLVLPTGAGKTTLSELKIAATLAAGLKVVFLVPTLALVDQLRDDLADSFPSDLGGVVVSADGDLTVLANGPELKQIEVMTPERFLALLSFADADVTELGLIVFDECHLLSPLGGGSRSLDAMLCLLHATKRAPQSDLLLLSAMLTNGQEIADWLADLTGRPAEFFYDPWKPSRQARGVVIYPKAELDPLRAYARAKARNLNPQKPPLKATAYALFGLQSNWNPGAAQDVRIVALMREQVDLKVGQNNVTPNANTVAAAIAARAVAANLKTIVFVQQAGHAPATATRLAATLVGVERLTLNEALLQADIATELGPTGQSLVNTAAGALPHNGDMLPLERRLAESLFRRPDGVSVIVATPTLAQGMNLPAQLAILAGNMRSDETGRTELKQHELLNAAGRAGRAGHLANGTVLLIPEPVVSFDAQGRADPDALAKLRSILPDNDQCLRIDDPLTRLLDEIHDGQYETDGVRYLLSRLRAEEDDEHAIAAAISMVLKSLAAFQAASRAEQEEFAAKIDTLEAALIEDVQELNADAIRISAFTGMPVVAIQAMSDRLNQSLDALPSSVSAWIDWLVNFLRDDERSLEALLGRDAEIITAVTRGRKTGGPTTAAEFEVLKAGLHAWVGGKPFDEIEAALGVAPISVKTCYRSRDLALKLVNRRLYMVAAAVAELAKVKFAATENVPTNSALLEILPIALRKGFDTPEKVAFSHLNPVLRTRVAVHHAFERRLGAMTVGAELTFREVIQQVEFTLALEDINDGTE